jgi:hypothetical protein
MTQEPLMLNSLAGMLKANGLSIDDLARHIAESEEGTASASSAGGQTLAQLVADVEATMSKNTRRTWHTHYQRLIDGVAPQCSCLCEQCLDLMAGCSCDCKDSPTTRLTIPACGEQVIG